MLRQSSLKGALAPREGGIWGLEHLRAAFRNPKPRQPPFKGGPAPRKGQSNDLSVCAALRNPKPRQSPFRGRPAPGKGQSNDLSLCAGAACAKQLHFGVWAGKGRRGQWPGSCWLQHTWGGAQLCSAAGHAGVGRGDLRLRRSILISA